MSDLDKVHRLLASAPQCQQRIAELQTAHAHCSQQQFSELLALWQGAHGPCPDQSVMAAFGWAVREENTLRWCLERLHIVIDAPPAHGVAGDHHLPLGRERLEAEAHKHVIGED
ncbi:MAG: hypothetical protein KGI67_03250 [Pseudomonadota bacterium]|nr:hypothetical protein [Pseudomonadota bacterium]